MGLFLLIIAGAVTAFALTGLLTARILRAIHLYTTDRPTFFVRTNCLLILGVVIGLIGAALTHAPTS